ncbi:MAG: MarR family transcriptional regulator [Oscillospiraceae bacterium]|nr:MarR family transcriptional regulator [Oscillospiraceae bacterium]
MENNRDELVFQLSEQLKDIYFRKSALGLENFLQGEMKVLSYIHHEQSEMLPGQLSSSLNMTAGRIAGILRSLEKKGFIIRRTDENDRRRVLVSITESGSQHILSDSVALKKRLDMLVAAMGCDNTIKLIDSLKLFVKASDEITEIEEL